MLGLYSHCVQLQEKLEWFHKFNHHRILEDIMTICRISSVVDVNDACQGVESIEVDIEPIEV